MKQVWAPTLTFSEPVRGRIFAPVVSYAPPRRGRIFPFTIETTEDLDLALPFIQQAPLFIDFSISPADEESVYIYPPIVQNGWFNLPVPNIYAPNVYNVDESLVLSTLPDPNPFLPQVPVALRQIPGLYEYLQQQAVTLRETYTKTLSGSVSYPAEFLSEFSTEQQHPLGSNGRFQVENFGLLRCVYVQFVEMIPDLVGSPVGSVLDGQWVVTNDYELSSGSRALGFLPGAVPPSDSYGWVIADGYNISPVFLAGTLEVITGNEIIWDDTNLVSYEAEGVVIGRILGDTLGPGSVLIGVGTSNGAFESKNAKTRIDVLEVASADSVSRIVDLETVTSNDTFASATSVEELRSQINGIVSNLIITNRVFVNNDRALASRVTEVSAILTGDISAKADEILSVVATKIGAVATRTSNLEVRFADSFNPLIQGIAKITTLAEVTADKQGTTAKIVSSLGLRMKFAEQNILATSSAVSTLSSDLSTLEGTVTAQAAAITDLQAQVDDLTGGGSGEAAAIAALDVRVTAAEGNITAQADDIVDLQTSVTDLALDVAANSSAVSTLSSDVATLGTTVSSQASQITSLTANLGTLSGTVGGQASVISSHTASLSSINGTLTANATSISSLNTTVAGHTSSISSFATSIGGLQAKAGVRLDVNGRVTGWTLNNNGDSDDFSVVSSNFKVFDPTLGDVPVFQIIGGLVYANFPVPVNKIPDLNATIDGRVTGAQSAKVSLGVGTANGTSGILTIVVQGGETRPVKGAIRVTGPSNVDIQLQFRIGTSGSFSNFGTPGSASDSPGSPLFCFTTGSVTNSAGSERVYQFQMVVSSTGGTVDGTRSFITA